MITIVGAGLVGSLWAVLLRQKGFAVQVFEKRPDPRANVAAAGRSINLVITSRGLRALEMAGLVKEVQKLSVPVFGRMIHSLDGNQTFQPYGRQDEFNNSISRDALNRFLVEKAEKSGAKFYFDHELSSLNPKNKQLTFKTPSGDSSASYEILFGADGAGSRLRKELGRNFSGQFQDHTDWLEADYKELTLPLGKNGKPQLDHKALHIWPRGDRMMMALANQDGSFTMTMYLPKAAFSGLQSPEQIQALFQKEFPNAIPLMPNFVDDFLGHPQGALGTVRTTKWKFDDSILLIGDAAHAIVPFFGQGMNLGFEDCTLLSDLIDSGKKWSEILSDFEKLQKPNAHAIAEMALENWVEMRDKVGDTKFMLGKKIESWLEQKYPEKFKSRYGLITYTLVPYELAFKAGLIQAEILRSLSDGISDVGQVDLQKADRLLQEKWFPFVEKHHLDLRKYKPL